MRLKEVLFLAMRATRTSTNYHLLELSTVRYAIAKKASGALCAVFNDRPDPRPSTLLVANCPILAWNVVNANELPVLLTNPPTNRAVTVPVKDATRVPTPISVAAELTRTPHHGSSVLKPIFHNGHRLQESDRQYAVATSATNTKAFCSSPQQPSNCHRMELSSKSSFNSESPTVVFALGV